MIGTGRDERNPGNLASLFGEKVTAAQLKIWWTPQVPMEAFEVPVASLAEADLLLDVLADYDRFQFENNVKPDYCNAGGLLMFEGGEWVDWYEDGLNCDFDEWREVYGRRAASGIEAPSGVETAKTGSTEGESPAPVGGDAR